jgi:hypothetical protein
MLQNFIFLSFFSHSYTFFNVLIRHFIDWIESYSTIVWKILWPFFADKLNLSFHETPHRPTEIWLFSVIACTCRFLGKIHQSTCHPKGIWDCCLCTSFNFLKYSVKCKLLYSLNFEADYSLLVILQFYLEY